MEKDMQSYRLSDIVKIKNGKDHKMLSNGKYPVLGSGGIMRYVDNFLYNKPSVLLPRKGTLDNIQYCDVPFWTVDTLYYTKVNTELANPYYLYRYLSLLDLSNLDSGTGVPSMTFDNYYGLKIFLPSIEKQTMIARVLQTLDKKIAVNRQINQNLEAMAKQLYDYWFVQFDFPNEEGKPYKSSGGKMVWNEKLKRDIPALWETKTIEDVADVYNGATPSTVNDQNYGGDIVWITPKDLSDQKQKFVYQGERNISQAGYNSCSTHLLPSNTILMSSRAPIGLLAIAKTELCTNQGFKSFVPKEENIETYLYYYLQIHIKLIEQLGTGTTFKEVSRDDILKFPILKPQGDVLNKWSKIETGINDRQLRLQKENENLTKQRDELLPLLMNGQVSVNSDLSHG
ncbi:restriction endonuclease subunit S [Bacteroides acidifaciens]|uniref:restriction endonuclease subunit S n=1 Tax=Bacteroides acidifaciens TaxID=85831 RepID=UPI0025974311|nr:restriction endonuclease subunit S [Bacteroides acidifaciens]